MGTSSSKPDISESPSCPTSVTSTSTPGFLDGESSASLRSPLSSISPSAPLPPSVEPEPHHTALGPYHISELRPSDKTRRFQCQEQDCQRLFDSRKDLRRHNDSVHDSGTRFRCRCGKLDSRKDNHDRHVRSCRPSGDGLYKNMFCCRCGAESDPNRPADHLAHVAKWNRQHGCR